MTNIFENAKFGDKFKTRDGRMAIFVKSEGANNFHPDVEAECILEEFSYVIIDKSHPMISKGSKCFSDGTNIYEHSDEDIVGKWEEPIDLEKMYNECERVYKDKGYDKSEQTLFGTVNVDFTTFRWGYEEGYTKAKEE